MPLFVRTRRCATLLLLLAAPALLGGLGPRDNFNQRVLAAHNRERNALSLPPLSWNAALAESAAGWANHLVKTERFEHSPSDAASQPQGENLWAGTPGHFQPESMVGLWIAERRHFKQGVFPDNSLSGRYEDVAHYTQVMWRRSREVGCALSRGRKEEVLVCRYSQAGNVIGQRPF